MNYVDTYTTQGGTPQDEALFYRLEDLEGKLQELMERLPSNMTDQYDRQFCSEMANCEIDGADASCLRTVEDVLVAISRTKDKLWSLECERLKNQRAEESPNMEVPGQVIFIGFADVFCEKAVKLAS